MHGDFDEDEDPSFEPIHGVGQNNEIPKCDGCGGRCTDPNDLKPYLAGQWCRECRRRDRHPNQKNGMPCRCEECEIGRRVVVSVE